MTKRPSFSTVVAQSLKDMIRRDKLKPGDRIPTEAELCLKYAVSRTVVREAIISLRSEGVLVARQGIGVFVGDGAAPRFEVDWAAIGTLPKTIMLMELRLAVEVESAGLCAQRRTKKDAREIRRLMEKVDSEHQDPRSTNVLYDYRFHLAIAKASKNPYIHQLLEFMAPVVMPQVKLSAVIGEGGKEAYYKMVHEEHDRIVVAIERADEKAARERMRAHIRAAIGRLDALVSSLPASQATEAYAPNPELIADLVRGLAGSTR
jgi:DNA-binding FadR family transcriptional regulator